MSFLLKRSGLFLFIFVVLMGISACRKQVKLKAAKPRTPFYNIYLKDIEGEEHSFRFFQGKVVLVDFFASHCTRCLYIIPHLKGMRDDFASKGFRLVGIALESPKQPMLSSFLRFMKIDYPVFIADEEIFKGRTVLGGINQIPQQQLIDRCGRIRRRFLGVVNPVILRKVIEKLLEEKVDCR